MQIKTSLPTKAIIYCRVSTEKQVTEGNGLSSQETRCLEYAKQKGWHVVKVFRDKGISGSLVPNDRPAARELFSFLDTQKDRFYIIVDDINRLARTPEAHLDFSAKIHLRGSFLASPSHTFGSTPNEKMLTRILVTVGAHQRDSNIEQVCNRQRARLMNGYWMFGQPLGYKYVKDLAGGGKIMVRDEPVATFLAEALEGFATGRFESQTDVAHFLTVNNSFSKSRAVKFHPTRVKGLLTNILYTGHLEYPKWEVELRLGKHPPLIDIQTYTKIQEKLGLVAKAPYRKDLNQDFPLRGFVLCSACNSPLTAGWSTGRSGKHPYYRCKTKSCELSGKALRKERVETAFQNVLKAMSPSETILGLAREIVSDYWGQKRKEHTLGAVNLDRDKKEIDQQITGLMQRLLETNDRTIIVMYENHLKELETKRQLLSAQANQMRSIDTSFEGAVGTVFDFIGKPHSLWDNGDLEDKRLVLKLAFAQKIPFHRETGFGTTGMSLPFRVLSDMTSQKSGMVEEVGFEPTNS